MVTVMRPMLKAELLTAQQGGLPWPLVGEGSQYFLEMVYLLPPTHPMNEHAEVPSAIVFTYDSGLKRPSFIVLYGL